MTDRKQKIEELMERMGSLKRYMEPRGVDFLKTPRITPAQCSVLFLIRQHSESSVKEIAEVLHISSSATTQLVDGLVKNGYVERREQAEDRRAVALTLSKKTENTVEKIRKQMVQKILEVFEVLSGEEFDQFCAIHNKIARQFPSKN